MTCKIHTDKNTLNVGILPRRSAVLNVKVAPWLSYRLFLVEISDPKAQKAFVFKLT